MSVKPYSTFRTDIPDRSVPKTVITTCHTRYGQTRNFQPESELSIQWLFCRTFTWAAVI